MERALIVEYMPWGLSLITIWMTLLAGDMNRRTWLIGLSNQVLWLAWVIAAQAWGFIPLTATLFVVYWRNHRKWRNA